MVSPIEAMIDQACGYKPGKKGEQRWDDEVARRCLYAAADELFEMNGGMPREGAAILYYGGRHARGMRSELAFRRQLRAAALKAWGACAGEDPHLLAWVAHWVDKLRERQASGW